MGAAVIAVVFVAGLLGVPSIFGHGDAHAKPQQQTAAAQTPTPASPQVVADANPANHP